MMSGCAASHCGVGLLAGTDELVFDACGQAQYGCHALVSVVLWYEFGHRAEIGTAAMFIEAFA
ncbi:hypothetical protein FG476_04220 [Xylella fastidiosa subsp. multiplex]|uniref:Uncharacterized protein n=1 Tax=Xylella fastidiosa subsp. multiplex TaxID=644357 RepID=A0A9Q4QRU3_XYLFS|nr:conserved hypothetical protein [Xylella fastidiosa M12]MBE0269279.1 hypothetical protein [Xylella fastidiosa subsp. multiplex]TNV88516.1 hypothetical protein C5H23_10180 [Xylella fastidiosa]MBE0275968.1 hypothetical protein [Xylella fastidiosa subsp. multiplex]MBE0278118.1 hypothetical protein [Xylella fastidiosa subsp. multiplex]